MKWLFARSCDHLVGSVAVDVISVDIHHFDDGEFLVKIPHVKRGDRVNLVAHTGFSAENIWELLLILNELFFLHVEIHLFLTYLGYARQDHASNEKSNSPAHFLLSISEKMLKKGTILHPHTQSVVRNTLFQSFLEEDFFIQAAQEVDIICAPDEGSRELALHIGQKAGKKITFLKKRRLDGVPHFESCDNFKNSRVLLVDDMIASGQTIIRAAQFLVENGAREVYAAATHGLFIGSAHNDIQESCISKLYVTDSLSQRNSNAKVSVYTLSSFFK